MTTDILGEIKERMQTSWLHKKGRPRVHEAFFEALHTGCYSPRQGTYTWCSDPGFDEMAVCVGQGEKETRKLLSAIEKLPNRTVGMEIGFEKGGTHVIFREFFDHFISIDIDPRKFLVYLQNDFFDERSEFIVGPSWHPAVVNKVAEVSGGQLDFIFIDGDHSYVGCRNDFVNYWPLLRVGGMIVLQDSHSSKWVHVTRFMNELEDKGGLEFTKIHIDCTGMSYCIKDGTNKEARIPTPMNYEPNQSYQEYYRVVSANHAGYQIVDFEGCLYADDAGREQLTKERILEAVNRGEYLASGGTLGQLLKELVLHQFTS